MCANTVENVEQMNNVCCSSFLWKSKADAAPKSLRCCELCDIPIFLYPSEFPGICENCAQHLRQFERKRLAPCGRCGRGHTLKLHCHWCNKKMCQGCIYRDHHDEVDEERASERERTAATR